MRRFLLVVVVIFAAFFNSGYLNRAFAYYDETLLDSYCDGNYDKGEDTISIIISRSYYSLIQAKLSCDLSAIPLRFQDMNKILNYQVGQIQFVILNDLRIVKIDEVCFGEIGGRRCYRAAAAAYLRIDDIEYLYIPETRESIRPSAIIGVIR